MTRGNSSAFLFDDVRVEPAMFRALKAGNEVQLEPKAFRVLLFLIENRGRVIAKEEILRAVWNGTYVTENALASEIAKLRKALADDSKTPKYIQTVHTRGYRFIAEVEEQEVEEQNAPEQTESSTLPSADSNEFDSASHWISSDAAGSRRPAAGRSWGRRLASMGMIVALAVGALIGLKIYRGSRSTATTLPLAIRQITTSPGMDFSPSFSPDEESIAYSSDRSGTFEIYVKSLAPGARDVQLTTDGQQNFDPAWSPDGKRIAFYSMKRHGIFTMPALGGLATQLTEFGSHPVWSPDGQWLAFQSVSSPDLDAVPMGSSTIWIVSSRGVAPKQVTQPGYPAGSHFAPSWSPDGKRIVFINFDTASPQVWSIAASGDRLQSITKHGTGDKSWPVYAADGKSIYYNQGEALWKTPVNSDNGAPAGEPVKVADLGSVVIRNATLSGTGKWIAYSASTSVDNLVSVAVSPTTGEPKGPPSFLTNESGTRHTAPAFSPDGLKIAFSSQVRGSPMNIWTIDAAGGNLSQVTINGGRFASWYPDGKRIAFLTDQQGRRRFSSIASVGGNEQALFELEGVESPQMSPDARQFAFNITKDGIINVATVPMIGGEPKQLTYDRELAGWPCWSPNGESLALEIKRGNDTHIAIVPSKGGQLTQLTFDHGQSWPYSWSPDGDKILFAGARDGVWNLWWVSRSAKTVKQLTHNTKLNAFFRYPDWSPLADRIVSEYSESRGNIYVMEIR